MANIKAPYNFVPLSEYIVEPHWSPYLSHDLPFKEEVSGEIELKITAETPIFIKDAEAVDETGTPLFCQKNGKYFIPGSSFRGMIRNVMEILSFSRMNLFTDQQYSVREFRTDGPYIIPDITKDIHCGWMRMDEYGDYYLKSCGRPGRIHIENISKTLYEEFLNFVKLGKEKKKKSIGKHQKSAKYKYDFLAKEGIQLEQTFEKAGIQYGLDLYQINSSGGNKGTIVLTGQPKSRDEFEKEEEDGNLKDKKRKNDGKAYEFIFLEKKEEKEFLIDDPKIIQNFRFAYFDHEKESQQSDDWKMRKNELKKHIPIPVFYRFINGKIVDIGLCYLYKITYDKSIGQVIHNTQKSRGYVSTQRLDMTEGILGHTYEDAKGQHLKSRVHIGHGIQEKVFDASAVNLTLSSPKASYYPNYVKQSPGSKTYNTFNSAMAEISGYKRYPVRKNHRNNIEDTSRLPSSDKVKTSFKPLGTDSEFKLCIRYHNLRKVELGALLSALNFHDTPNCYHSLGMAKAFGYGRISLEILNPRPFHEECRQAFEAYMTCQLQEKKVDWKNSKQVRELITMSSLQPEAEDFLKYMQLEDFPKAKQSKKGEAKKYLPNYSEVKGVSPAFITSKITTQYLEEFCKKLKADEALFQEKREAEELLSNSWEAKKARFEQALEKRKEDFRKQLNERKQELRKQAQGLINLGNADLAKKEGILWASIKLDVPRESFDSLKNVLKAYLQKLHATKSEEEIEKLKVEGLVPKEEREKLHEMVLGIAKKGTSSMRKKFKKASKKNSYRNLFKEWLGEAEADALLEIIRKELK